MVRLVLFDIDGTLIHSGGAGLRAFNRVCSEVFGISDGAQHLKFGGRTDLSLMREFFSLYQIEPSKNNFDLFVSSYLGFLEKLIVETQGGLCPGVFEFLDDLELMPQAPLIGLLTGNLRRGAEIKLGHYKLWHRFPFGAFADDSEDRDQIAIMARHRGGQRLKQPIAGEEIVVIGDTPLDIRCGRAIGAKVLAVATGNFTADELADHKPDWIFADLSETGARKACC